METIAIASEVNPTLQQQMAQQQLQQQLQQRQMQRRWNPTFAFMNGANNDGMSEFGSEGEDSELPSAAGMATPRPGSPVRIEEGEEGSGASNSFPIATPQISHAILSQQLISGILNSFSDVKVLPWRPKVRTGDIEVRCSCLRHCKV